MSRPRDNQRSKLYRAEREVSPGRTFNDIHETRDYVARICRSAWWKRRYGSMVPWVNVSDGRGVRNALAHPGWYPAEGRTHVTFAKRITLPVWARSELVTLHELAHQITRDRYAAHGPEFARNLLDLVRWKMGAEAANSLKAAFRKHKVKIARGKSA